MDEKNIFVFIIFRGFSAEIRTALGFVHLKNISQLSTSFSFDQSVSDEMKLNAIPLLFLVLKKKLVKKLFSSGLMKNQKPHNVFALLRNPTLDR